MGFVSCSNRNEADFETNKSSGCYQNTEIAIDQFVARDRDEVIPCDSARSARRVLRNVEATSHGVEAGIGTEVGEQWPHDRGAE